MLPNLPDSISIFFGLTTIATLLLFYFAVKNTSAYSNKTGIILIGLLIWMVFQAILTFNDFYISHFDAVPPRLILGVIPPLLLIVILFMTKKGKAFIDDLPPFQMTLLHVVRIPVELVLYWLFLNKAVPELMTFAGRNFDILAGITAPFVAYFGIKQQKMGRKGLLAWNFICLGLVLFIVGNAILSAPFPFQQFAFDQPNVGVLYFPFVWLPTVVVPIVIFSHLVSIRQLIQKK